MIKLTIDDINFDVNNVHYYANGLSKLSTLTIDGLDSLQLPLLNKSVLITINDSIFLKQFKIVSIHKNEVNNNIILFGKDENYDSESNFKYGSRD